MRRTRAWFEVNSGWAPPDEETLADWLVEGGSRCPDDCWADADGECAHGLATWATLLAVQAREDADAARSGPAALLGGALSAIGRPERGACRLLRTSLG